MEKLNRIIPFVLAVLFAVASTFSQREGRVVPPSQDSWFNSAVLKNSRPVVVKFGAEWCGPCRSMDAALNSLESRFASRARFIRINVDEKPELFAQYADGSGIPQIMIFRDGKIVSSDRGFGSKERLQSWLSSNL